MREDELKMSDNTNKMRERLIEILHGMPNQMTIGEAADYLLANGVVALPCCDYTKTNWNDCCECSAKDYCDKYNERCEIIGELLGKEIGEIKNKGR